MIKMLRVQTPAPILGVSIFSFICCKKLYFCLGSPKINEIEAEDGSIV